MRIAIANGSALAVEALRKILALVPGHEIAWVAQEGPRAVERCGADLPDLVLMDLDLPGLDGVETTRRIMMRTPCSILVTVRPDATATRVFEAMGYGAVDAIETPSLGSGDFHAASAPLLAKIASVQRLLGTDTGVTLAPNGKSATLAPWPLLIAVGASAGGPAAISTLLRALPRQFPAAIVIVQRVDPHFAPGMAEWLNLVSPLPVRLAAEGDTPEGGHVLIAGRDDHLTLKGAGRLGYTAEPRDYAYRPSIDVFFRSVSRLWPGNVIGVLLTGMGSDGAQGLKELRAKGHYTIAQDEASSAVSAMPKAAAAANAAVDILPLTRIAPRIVSSLAT